MKTKPRRLMCGLLLTIGAHWGLSLSAQRAAVAASCATDPACAAVAARAREQSLVGQLEEALTAYRAAYQLQADPKLLYNLGRVAHKLGRRDEAAQYYRRYLDSGAEDRPEQRDKTAEYLVEVSAPVVAPAAPLPLVSPADSQPQAVSRGDCRTKNCVTVPTNNRRLIWGVIGGVAAATTLGLGLGLGLGLNKNAPQPVYSFDRFNEVPR